MIELLLGWIAVFQLLQTVLMFQRNRSSAALATLNSLNLGSTAMCDKCNTHVARFTPDPKTGLPVCENCA